MSAQVVLGSVEIGVIISSMIYGVSCLQCHLYFVEHSGNDPIFMKLLVVTMMALETFDVALLYHALYTYTVKDSREVNKPMEMIWSFLLRINIAAILSTLTQLFFALRIYYLNGRRLHLPVTICIISMISLGLATCFTIIGIPLKPQIESSNGNKFFGVLGSSMMLTSVICDLLITISTIYHLRSQISRTPLISTTRVINKLIRYTLSTGLLTTVVALIVSIGILAYGDPLVYIPCFFLLARLYMCSLVSILNSRSAVQKEFMGIADITSTSHRDAIFTPVGLGFSAATYTAANDTTEQFIIIHQPDNETFQLECRQ